jgi:hypothetical protein
VNIERRGASAPSKADQAEKLIKTYCEDVDLSDCPADIVDYQASRADVAASLGDIRSAHLALGHRFASVVTASSALNTRFCWARLSAGCIGNCNVVAASRSVFGSRALLTQ